MPYKATQYPEEWLNIAEKDLKRVDILLEAHDSEAAGFFLQQAIEKFLKAFLLAHEWKLERIHDLEALLNAALKVDPSLEKYRSACEIISAFYLTERYPTFFETTPTEEKVRSLLEETQGLIQGLRGAIALDH